MEDTKINILISSLVNQESSLGNIGYNWGKYFGGHSDYEVWLEAWAESKLPESEFDSILISKKSPPSHIDVFLRKSDPHTCYHPMKPKGAIGIGYIYYDSKSINSLVIARMNAHLDVLVCPSQFTANRFKNFGVTCPIEVVPLAVDLELFKPREDEVMKNILRFINYGEQGLRKGTDLLFTAFTEEFKGHDDVELRLLISAQNDDEQIPEGSAGNINIRGGKLPSDELVKEIQDADCFVALTREDSFGMCGLESMACGLPVVASKESGYAQYVTDSNGWLVSCNRGKDHPRFEWEPDLESAKRVLRAVYTTWTSQDSTTWQKKKEQALLTAKRLSWTTLGRRFDKIIKKYKNL